MQDNGRTVPAKRALLGIDSGTTSVSTALVDADSLRILATASFAHGAYLDSAPRRREQSVDRIRLAVDRAVTAVIERAEATSPGPALEVVAVSVTGQMHGFVVLDSKLDPIGPLLTWEDRRASEPLPDGSTTFDGFLEELARITPSGSPIRAAVGFASVGLYDMHRHGYFPEAGRWVVSIEDYLVSELTGCDPMTDASLAHSAGLYDPYAGLRPEALLDLVGATGRMPAVVPAGSFAGRVRTARAGLPEGAPVYVGMGDNQASFLAAVADPARELLVTVGTGSQVSVAVDRFLQVDGLDTRPFVDGAFLLVGAPLCGGRAWAMMHDFIAEVGILYFGADPDSDSTAIYDAMRRTAELDTPVRCRTTFAGTRTDPSLRGSFEAIGSEDFRIGPLVGSVARGIAEELASMFGSMRVDRELIVATGNGVRRNSLITGALEMAFDLPVSISPFEEEAAVGAALVAGVGLGVIPSFACARVAAVARRRQELLCRRGPG